jgi:hypothetical protein
MFSTPFITAPEEREAKKIDESYRTGLLYPSQFTG